eukprot:scaffold2558_cov172-Amphora_coffeaeformis.AAC.13
MMSLWPAGLLAMNVAVAPPTSQYDRRSKNVYPLKTLEKQTKEMWWSVGKLVASSAFWLATTTTPRTKNPSTATEAWTPQTPHDLAQAFRQLYIDLERPGPRFFDPSPTLRFSYVPPPQNGTSIWRERVHSLDKNGELNAEKKPLAVYLPGLDGYGISAARNQFDDLATTFEFWRLTIAPEDRSSLGQVVTKIADFVQYISQEGNRPVTLIGESCGGLMASAVALQLKRREQSSGKESSLKGLVLVNPATSFDRTSWDTLVPVLTSLKYLDTSDPQDKDRLTPYGVLGSLILSSLIPDRDQQMKILDAIVNLPTLDIPPRSREQLETVLDATRRGFQETEFRLPPDLLQHRVEEWLTIGVPVVSKRIAEIELPTLVVAGQRDALMPSEEEAKRLVSIMPLAKSLVVPDRGHFVLDDTVNLTEAILYSDIDPLEWKVSKKKYDPILDWKLPDPEIIDETVEKTLEPFIKAHSPIFFSTDKAGKRWRGLSKFPEKTGPLLIVGNHQLFGADLRIIFYQLWREKEILARGLAHPILFSMSNVTDLQGKTPGLKRQIGNPFNGDYQSFGAVPVTPRNFYRLLQTNQTALLFPGGAKEALKADASYPLYWPDKTDFVRVAAKLNATIVPISSIGMVESVNILLRSEDLLRIPFLGERTRNFTSSLSNARFDKPNEGQDLTPSIVAPGIPARNYVLFGRARDMTNVDPNDRRTCDRLYRQIESDVRSGLDDLMAARKKDPFADTPRRLAYEQVFGKTAPSFSVDELNK